MNYEEHTAQYKAREYLFDLNNTALENGFKPDESWEVSMSTATEKAAIEKQYYPTVATIMLPELLSAAFRMVKSYLKQVVKEPANLAEKRLFDQPVYLYLVAYNPNRLRR